MLPEITQSSYWLASCDDDLTPRAPLDGSRRVDVAILGAGLSGLWTAYYLARRDPSLRIVVAEAEVAGFGASGRNGAWCTSGFGAGPGLLARRHGVEAARAVHDAMVDTVTEVGRVAEAEGIDAQYQRDGELVIARTPAQLEAIDAIARGAEAIGRPHHWQRLDAAATQERLVVEGALGAVFQPATAAVHPGRLVRGLARACERAGVEIVEQTRVLRVEEATPEGPARLVTDRGDLSAEFVVLAGEAYLSRLPGWRRRVLPLYSLIVMTEPLTDRQLEAIGWQHRSVVQSAAIAVDYLSRTADGRVLFGGRGAPYHYGSRIRPEYDHHEATHVRLRRSIVEWFPALRGVRCTHAWGGPLGVPRDWMPTMRVDRSSGLALAYGYTGEGVAATNLSGRVLADLITGHDSELVRLPMTAHTGRRWEPEPLRWVATRALQRAAFWADGRGATGRRHPRLLDRFLSH